MDLREDRSAAEVESLQTLIMTLASVGAPRLSAREPIILVLRLGLSVCRSSATAQTREPIRTKFGMHVLVVAVWCAFYRKPGFETPFPWKPRKTAFFGDSGNFARHFLSNKDENRKSAL